MMDAALIHEKALAYALAPGEKALEEAVNAALPLCRAIAARFSGRGIDLEDLRQVAAMACVSALKSFDAERGLRFTTFATTSITGAVRNYIRDRAELMRTPRGLKEMTAKLARAREELTYALRREPTVRELAEKLNWEMSQVMDALTARDSLNTASLDEPDESGRMPSELIGESDLGFQGFEQREDLRKALRLLSADERALLSLRFDARLSQREAAAKLKLSQMQVSRMERRALDTLRREMAGA